MLVTIRDLGKTYRRGDQQLEVLSSINFKLQPSERAVIIGPNGCGKSTLLKLIAGIEQPSTGVIQRTVQPAYVPQQPSLLPWRTVEENVLLPYDVQKTLRRPSPTKLKQWLKDFGLFDFRSFYPATLSGGMQQKAALLRGVLAYPSLLLLDEPFASLDAITRTTMQRWLVELQQKTHASLLCVTHDIREAITIGHTIHVMSERPGRIVQTVRVPKSLAEQRRLETRLQALLVRQS